MVGEGEKESVSSLSEKLGALPCSPIYLSFPLLILPLILIYQETVPHVKNYWHGALFILQQQESYNSAYLPEPWAAERQGETQTGWGVLAVRKIFLPMLKKMASMMTKARPENAALTAPKEGY